MDANLSLNQVKAIIRSILVSNRGGCVLVQKLQKDYIEIEGTSIPFVKFGFRNIFVFLRSMPDVLEVYGNDAKSYVQVVTIPSIKHVEELVRRSCSKTKRNVHVPLDRTKTVQCFNKRQVNLHPLTSTERKISLTKPPVHSERHNAERKVCSVVPESECKPSEKENKLIHAKTCEHTTGGHGTMTSCHNEMDWIHMLILPPEAMHKNNAISEPNLVSFAKPKSTVLVKVLNVLNPNRIWVRFKGHQTSFDNLKLQMNQRYNQNIGDRPSWNLDKSTVQHGLYCAAMWEGSWCRAKIVGPLMGTRVKLNFVDLGVIDDVNLNCIKYLANDLSTPHILAIRASLAYLVPSRKCWRRAVSDHLQKTLLAAEQFSAYVVDVDNENNCLEVVLRGEEIGNVNKTFAADTLATWVGEDHLTQDVEAYRRRGRTFNEKYPAFGCIDDGHFPSLVELRKSLERNFDFEHFYTEISHNTKENIGQQFKLTMERLAHIRSAMSGSSEK